MTTIIKSAENSAPVLRKLTLVDPAVDPQMNSTDNDPNKVDLKFSLLTCNETFK